MVEPARTSPAAKTPGKLVSNISRRPGRVLFQVVAGQNKTVVVQPDIAIPQKSCVGLLTNEHKQPIWAKDVLCTSNRILDVHFFQLVITTQSGDRRVKVDVDTLFLHNVIDGHF